MTVTASVADPSVPSAFAASPLVHMQSLARAGLHATAAAAMWRLALPLDDAVRDYGFRATRESYLLHLRLLERPGMRAVLRRVELEDLATLPFFAALMPLDILRVAQKRRRGLVQLPVRPRDGFPYPDYYLNDFHNQSNGHLSLHSALLYEWQIRFLFLGTNRLMRQGVIDQIPEGEHLDILDVGCGTASWITQARLQNRRHRITGIDLSPHYLRVARFFRGREASFRQMNAEEMAPEWGGRFDLVTCIWLFHELPTGAIEEVTSEIARVLKPGGTLVFMDAGQRGDLEGEDIHTTANHHFRDYFNEPYFMAYQALDLPALFARHGLYVHTRQRWFASKLLVAVKR
jgi:ubiquinone/menaquinone biosynthesis C-methylase UbiE